MVILGDSVLSIFIEVEFFVFVFGVGLVFEQVVVRQWLD